MLNRKLFVPETLTSAVWLSVYRFPPVISLSPEVWKTRVYEPDNGPNFFNSSSRIYIWLPCWEVQTLHLHSVVPTWVYSSPGWSGSEVKTVVSGNISSEPHCGALISILLLWLLSCLYDTFWEPPRKNKDWWEGPFVSSLLCHKESRNLCWCVTSEPHSFVWTSDMERTNTVNAAKRCAALVTEVSVGVKRLPAHDWWLCVCAWAAHYTHLMSRFKVRLLKFSHLFQQLSASEEDKQ